MSNASFVRRAPEIAEEILAKTANLPKDLQTFTRGLFEKEAAQVGDPLKMPARMTIADLQKVASANKVDLPKVGAAPSDEYGSVAEGLRKMAEHHANETRDDILAAAVAIMEKSAQGGAAAVAGPAARGGGAGHFLKSWLAPGSRPFKARQLAGARHKRLLAEQEARTPGTVASAEREWSSHLAKQREQAAESTRQWTGTVKSVATPVAVGVGVPAGAMAMKPEGKKEVKAFRAIA